MSKFPAPGYNKVIGTDAQFVKVPMDFFGSGSRQSVFGELGNDPKSNNPAKPTAPEMTVQHTKE